MERFNEILHLKSSLHSVSPYEFLQTTAEHHVWEYCMRNWMPRFSTYFAFWVVNFWFILNLIIFVTRFWIPLHLIILMDLRVPFWTGIPIEIWIFLVSKTDPKSGSELYQNKNPKSGPKKQSKCRTQKCKCRNSESIIWIFIVGPIRTMFPIATKTLIINNILAVIIHRGLKKTALFRFRNEIEVTATIELSWVELQRQNGLTIPWECQSQNWDPNVLRDSNMLLLNYRDIIITKNHHFISRGPKNLLHIFIEKKKKSHWLLPNRLPPWSPHHPSS